MSVGSVQYSNDVLRFRCVTRMQLDSAENLITNLASVATQSPGDFRRKNKRIIIFLLRGKKLIWKQRIKCVYVVENIHGHIQGDTDRHVIQNTMNNGNKKC